MRLDPTTFPLTFTRLPLACFGKISSDTPVITAGYSNPVRTVKTSVKRNPGPSSLIMCYSYSGGLQVEPAPLRQMQPNDDRSEEHTSELQSLRHLACRLLLEKKNTA